MIPLKELLDNEQESIEASEMEAAINRYPVGWEIANCGCVHHAEDRIPCPHDKLSPR